MTSTIAVYCDFENVAIGAQEAKLGDFAISRVLERLLDKGNVVVRRAYSDWERYKGAKRGLHEAAFELIEVPHVSYSGKNSADIRLVVDALDLCYTKPHVDTFAIISGDSDFTPLVTKLRENHKMVLGVGVRSSTSDRLVEICDEFVYYDDLVQRAKQSSRAAAGDGEPFDLVLQVVEALFRDRDDYVWGSHIKQTLKRRRPNFSESRYGYRSFNRLLEDAAERGLLELQKDANSGGYKVLGFGPAA